MDDYAESLHISTNWFIRNFKLYMKISPAQYILSLRMVNAQSLLENTEYNIGEIAEIVGYDNHSILAGYSRKSMVSVRHSTERIWKNLLKNEKDSLIQKFLPVEMYLTYQVDGEPLEQLPNGYSDHYVPDGFVRD